MTRPQIAEALESICKDAGRVQAEDGDAAALRAMIGRVKALMYKIVAEGVGNSDRD